MKNSDKNLPSKIPQAIRVEHYKKLMSDWEMFTHWSNTGAREYMRPVSPIVDRLLDNAIRDYRNRARSKETMRFKYPIGNNVYCWQCYGVTNLSQLILYPPKHRIDLKPLGTGYGSI